MQILTVSGLQKTYTTRFGGSKVQALKNVNFTVESGEYVAIMGESGGGKTTLANLITRFFDAQSGEVLVGGVNVKNIEKEELRKAACEVRRNIVKMVHNSK